MEINSVQCFYGLHTLQKHDKMQKFKKLMRRAKRRFRKEQRRHLNSSYKKRSSYKRVSLDSKFYMRSKHQDGTQANVDPKSTAENEGKEFQEVSVRRLHIEKKRKEKQMEEDRLVLIEQLRQNRQEKRDLAYERVLVVNEKKIRLMDIPEETFPPNLANIEESVDDTESRMPTNTQLRKYVLARKQCRRNSPNEKIRESLAVSKMTGKMSAINQLFGRSRNVDTKHAKKQNAPSEIAKQLEFNFEDVESLAHRRC